MSEKNAPKTLDKNALTYNDYLKIPELLNLQKPLSEPVHHDEMLFIVIHQAYELWFKIIISEIENARTFMQQKNVLRARHFIVRIVEIMKVLVQQIHILETMTPSEFLKFRDRLNPASGFQSLQYREVEYLLGLKDEKYLKFFENKPEMLSALNARLVEPDLRQAFYSLLYQLGFDLPEDAAELENQGDENAMNSVLSVLESVHRHSEKQLPLYLLSEALVELDEYMALWRNHHVTVVERIIGFKKGTGGSSGVAYLQSRANTKAFPLLWQVRTMLLND